MSEPHEQDRLTRLDAKIAEAKANLDGGPRTEEHYSQAQQGWRMVTELVAGLGIGFGIGYGLDVLFGTLPIMMVLFTFLGLAAGIKTMMRTAEEIAAKQAALAADEKKKG
ncbi:MAG: AtpZ/AtpI family protein [Pseudomonadota bacterium]